MASLVKQWKPGLFFLGSLRQAVPLGTPLVTMVSPGVEESLRGLTFPVIVSLSPDSQSFFWKRFLAIFLQFISSYHALHATMQRSVLAQTAQPSQMRFV